MERKLSELHRNFYFGEDLSLFFALLDHLNLNYRSTFREFIFYPVREQPFKSLQELALKAKVIESKVCLFQCK